MATRGPWITLGAKESLGRGKQGETIGKVGTDSEIQKTIMQTSKNPFGMTRKALVTQGGVDSVNSSSEKWIT